MSAIEINATGTSAISEAAIDAAWSKTIQKLNAGVSAKPSADAPTGEPPAADRPDGAVGDAAIDAMWAAAIAQANGGGTDG